MNTSKKPATREEFKHQQYQFKKILRRSLMRRDVQKAYQEGIPYVKPKAKPRISFTENLRNERGCGIYLKTKFNSK